MNYKEIKLRADSPDTAKTEIMYEIAACRADNVDLIRINIICEDLEEKKGCTRKIFHSLVRLLRGMKEKGNIQFFATPDGFKAMSTEAVFLQNKYPQMFSVIPIQNEIEQFIYIKL